MKCMICADSMQFYFQKKFDSDGLTTVEYSRCASCGFVQSSTHLDLTEADWVRLNTNWHEANNRRADNPWNRSQRHFNQALMIHLLARNGIVPAGSWIDYASGEGGLSLQLHTHFGHRLDSFDQYITPTSFALSKDDLRTRGHALVTNTAMFEHVRERDTLDRLESLVADGGCLGVHTLVRGEIPNDPNWMYLLPVHCSFFTNASMALLMRQWGYTCSVYNEQAKLWVMFKQDPEKVRTDIEQLNASLGWEYLHFKTGFMDYWP